MGKDCKRLTNQILSFSLFIQYHQIATIEDNSWEPQTEERKKRRRKSQIQFTVNLDEHFLSSHQCNLCISRQKIYWMQLKARLPKWFFSFFFHFRLLNSGGKKQWHLFGWYMMSIRTIWYFNAPWPMRLFKLSFMSTLYKLCGFCNWSQQQKWQRPQHQQQQQQLMYINHFRF